MLGEKKYLRKALDEAVFVSDLAALVPCMLLGRLDLLGAGIRLAGDLVKGISISIIT